MIWMIDNPDVIELYKILTNAFWVFELKSIIRVEEIVNCEAQGGIRISLSKEGVSRVSELGYAVF